jgi:hypothetical protein
MSLLAALLAMRLVSLSDGQKQWRVDRLSPMVFET